MIQKRNRYARQTVDYAKANGWTIEEIGTTKPENNCLITVMNAMLHLGLAVKMTKGTKAKLFFVDGSAAKARNSLRGIMSGGEKVDGLLVISWADAKSWYTQHRPRETHNDLRAVYLTPKVYDKLNKFAFERGMSIETMFAIIANGRMSINLIPTVVQFPEQSKAQATPTPAA